MNDPAQHPYLNVPFVLAWPEVDSEEAVAAARPNPSVLPVTKIRRLPM